MPDIGSLQPVQYPSFETGEIILVLVKQLGQIGYEYFGCL